MKALKNTAILRIIIVCIIFTFSNRYVCAQQTAIEGANMNFMMNTPANFEGWVAKTGTYSTSSMASAPTFNLTQTYNDPATASFSGYNGSGKYFVINTDLTETDENASSLKKIPSELGFQRSVRMGNTNAGGDCSQLMYSFEISESNCLLTFCYSMVLTAPHPGDHYANPTFEVDVVDADGNLITECCFFQNTGDVTVSSLPKNGWQLAGGSSYNQWIYLDWQTISVNLLNYVGESVEMRVRISGCGYGAHPGYGYFTAKCEKPDIVVAGCAGSGDIVTTASAPVGFDKYEWFTVPYETTDQATLDGWYNSDMVLSTDSVLSVTDEMMEDANEKTFAVKLTSPTQHVTWDNSPAPACVAYIPATVRDMRPKFDAMMANGYIPVSPESAADEVGFVFSDVTQRTSDFPLDWQLFDFGDGDSLEVKTDATGKWVVDESATPTAENHVRLTYDAVTGNIDTVFHTYVCGNYVFTRYAHSVSLEDEMECLKSKSLDIYVPCRPTLLLENSADTVCIGDKVTVTASSPDMENTAGFKYQWYHATDDPLTAEPFYTGNQLVISALDKDTVFHVKVVTPDDFYRWGWDTVYVQAFPNIKIEGDTMICIGQNLHITAVDEGTNTLGLRWTYQKPSMSTVVGSTSKTAVLEDPVKQDTVAYILAETTKHCVAWDSVNVVVVIPTVSSDKKAICPGESVTLTGSGAVDYSWTSVPYDNTLPSEGFRTADPIEVSPDTTTVYTMTGYGQNGCTSTVNITITVIPYPEIKIGFTPGYVDVDEPVLMLTDYSSYVNTSAWSFSDGGSAEGQTALYTFHDLSSDSVSIHLVSTNELGCSSEGDTNVAVELFSVWLPNAFTPNGDGFNDYFFFMTENDLYDLSFEVYNRWGMKMYSYENNHYISGGVEDMEKLGWNGKVKDSYVQNDTYIWRLSYKREGSTRIYDRKGTVNVIR